MIYLYLWAISGLASEVLGEGGQCRGRREANVFNGAVVKNTALESEPGRKS